MQEDKKAIFQELIDDLEAKLDLSVDEVLDNMEKRFVADTYYNEPIFLKSFGVGYYAWLEYLREKGHDDVLDDLAIKHPQNLIKYNENYVEFVEDLEDWKEVVTYALYLSEFEELSFNPTGDAQINMTNNEINVNDVEYIYCQAQEASGGEENEEEEDEEEGYSKEFILEVLSMYDETLLEDDEEEEPTNLFLYTVPSVRVMYEDEEKEFLNIYDDMFVESVLEHKDDKDFDEFIEYVLNIRDDDTKELYEQSIAIQNYIKFAEELQNCTFLEKAAELTYKTYKQNFYTTDTTTKSYRKVLAYGDSEEDVCSYSYKETVLSIFDVAKKCAEKGTLAPSMLFQVWKLLYGV